MRTLLAAIAALLIGFVWLCPRAEAIPAFARATGMGCPACHDSWSKLNDFGELYRDSGYRVRDLAEEPINRSLDYAPISFRTTAAYEWTSSSNQATDGGPRTIRTGGLADPSADLIFGENLSEHVSVFAIATGYASDGAVNLESAWGRLNDILETSWLNLKVGRHELDLPLSEHRSYTLTMPYLIYHYHPTNSVNRFSMGDNQLGAEIMGHSVGPGVRYALSIINAVPAGATPVSAPAGAGPLSAPALYGHLTYTRLPAGPVSRIRLGAVGDIGWSPTSFATLTPMGGNPAPVPGTGVNNKPYLHAGAEADLTFGSIARPLTLSLFYLYGQEDAGLVEGGTRTARFQGGFAEVDYTPLLAWTFFGRVDAVFNIQQADPTQPANSNQQSAATIGARYALWLAPWGSMVWHVEGSTINTQNVGAAYGTPVRGTTIFTGLDFAI